MSLNFPNQSRSYDADRRRIRFWGHDGAVEVPFFLDEDVIFVLSPKAKNTEAGILAAFDDARERVFAAAARAYAPGRHRSFYTLTTRQF
jgi:Protein of unknown function (DUF1488)